MSDNKEKAYMCYGILFGFLRAHNAPADVMEALYAFTGGEKVGHPDLEEEKVSKSTPLNQPPVDLVTRLECLEEDSNDFDRDIQACRQTQAVQGKDVTQLVKDVAALKATVGTILNGTPISGKAVREHFPQDPVAPAAQADTAARKTGRWSTNADCASLVEQVLAGVPMDKIALMFGWDEEKCQAKYEELRKLAEAEEEELREAEPEGTLEPEVPEGE